MSRWRYIAQRALTGEFLEWELPVARDELTWGLSGGDAFRGAIAPDVGHLRASDGRLLLEEWGTLLYAEADGEIRWGGILVRSGFNGPKWAIEAAGFTSYPHGIPYTGDYSKIQVDPADVVEHIWSHVQSHPAGKLGVVVTGDKTPVRIGTEERDVEFTTGSGDSVSFTAGPYRLSWWESPDCGTEIDTLAKETPFDYVERHRWSGDEIRHEVQIGYPRLGRRRDDLSFIQGVNISAPVVVDRDGDTFANEVVGLGSGSERAALRRTTAVRDGRLRRVAVYTDKSVGSISRMDSLIDRELTKRQNTLEIVSVDVRDHRSAEIGSWQVGDDVLIEAEIPWLGEVAIWSRITGWTLLTEHTARLSLARSDSFTYGG